MIGTYYCLLMISTISFSIYSILLCVYIILITISLYSIGICIASTTIGIAVFFIAVIAIIG